MILALCLLFSLSACGKKAVPDVPVTPDVQPETPDAKPEESEPSVPDAAQQEALYQARLGAVQAYRELCGARTCSMATVLETLLGEFTVVSDADEWLLTSLPYADYTAALSERMTQERIEADGWLTYVRDQDGMLSFQDVGMTGTPYEVLALEPLEDGSFRSFETVLQPDDTRECLTARVKLAELKEGVPVVAEWTAEEDAGPAWQAVQRYLNLYSALDTNTASLLRYLGFTALPEQAGKSRMMESDVDCDAFIRAMKLCMTGNCFANDWQTLFENHGGKLWYHDCASENSFYAAERVTQRADGAYDVTVHTVDRTGTVTESTFTAALAGTADGRLLFDRVVSDPGSLYRLPLYEK